MRNAQFCSVRTKHSTPCCYTCWAAVVTVFLAAMTKCFTKVASGGTSLFWLTGDSALSWLGRHGGSSVGQRVTWHMVSTARKQRGDCRSPPLFIPSWTPAPWMLPPMLRVGLPTSSNLENPSQTRPEIGFHGDQNEPHWHRSHIHLIN